MFFLLWRYVIVFFGIDFRSMTMDDVMTNDDAIMVIVSGKKNNDKGLFVKMIILSSDLFRPECKTSDNSFR